MDVTGRFLESRMTKSSKKDEPDDLFEWSRLSDKKPKIKKQKCNQDGCQADVVLTFSYRQGIYTGNRTCSECKKAFRFRYGPCW